MIAKQTQTSSGLFAPDGQQLSHATLQNVDTIYDELLSSFERWAEDGTIKTLRHGHVPTGRRMRLVDCVTLEVWDEWTTSESPRARFDRFELVPECSLIARFRCVD